MILTGHEIRSQLGRNIVIEPFDDANLNPNSYNLTLHHELMTYEEVVLDMRRANRVRRVEIPAEGLVLSPNQLYLGRTIERTETHNHVPMIEGRSSVGRLGLFVHVTAGFGDVGFCGYLDARNVRRAAGPHLCGRADLPDLLSSESAAKSSNTSATSINTTTTSSRACSSKNSIPRPTKTRNSNWNSAWNVRIESGRTLARRAGKGVQAPVAARRCFAAKGVGSRFRHAAGWHYGSFSGRNRLPTPFWQRPPEDLPVLGEAIRYGEARALGKLRPDSLACAAG